MQHPIDAFRACLRDPIPEIYAAVDFIDSAVTAHLSGDHVLAASLIAKADIPAIAGWSESLWGAGGPWTRPRRVANPLPYVAKADRAKLRAPSTSHKHSLTKRDGYVCRFCGIPVVLPRTIARIRSDYPTELRWGARNIDQHSGFQAIMLHFDHIIPHARGGNNEFENMLVTCAPCNCGRNNMSLDEAGLLDPRSRSPSSSQWDGLERYH